MLKRIVQAQESIDGMSVALNLSCGHYVMTSVRALKRAASLTHVECPECVETTRLELDDSMDAFHVACFGGAA